MRGDRDDAPDTARSRCPLDGAALLPANADGACECPTCHGIWLPGPLVSDCLGDVVTTTLRGRRGEPTPIACPDDQLTLTKIRFHGITLDLCTQCCGTWFDRQDLDKLHHHRTALGVGAGAGGVMPVYAKPADGDGTWSDSLIHFILFAAKG